MAEFEKDTQRHMFTDDFLGRPPRILEGLQVPYASEKERKRRPGLAQEIVAEATERRTDYYAIVQAVHILTKDHRAKDGVDGLRLIAEYLSAEPFRLKTILPKGGSEEYSLGFEGLLQKTARSLLRYSDKVPAALVYRLPLNSFFRWVGSAYSDLPEKDFAKLIPMMYSDSTGDSVGNYPQDYVNQLFLNVVLPITDLDRELTLNENASKRGFLLFPHVAITHLQRFSEALKKVSSPEILDYYTRKFGGISIKDLVEQPFDSSDPNASQLMFLRMNKFLSSLPKGDMVLDMLVGSLFRYAIFGRGGFGEQFNAENLPGHEWYEKSCCWQSMAVEQIMLPELSKLYNSKLPESFVQVNVANSLRALYTSEPVPASVMFVTAAIRGATNRSYLRPDLPYRNFLQHSELYKFYNHKVGLMTEEEMASETVARVWPGFRADMHKVLHSFGDINARTLRLFEVPVLGRGAYSESLTRLFSAWGEFSFGKNFLETLRSRQKEFDQVTRLILAGNFDLPASRWGEEGGMVEVELSQGSIARTLGIETTYWQFPHSTSDDINFVLVTTYEDLRLSGKINLQRRTIDFNYIKDLDNALFPIASMNLVAACVLHDILGRKKELWDRTLEKPDREENTVSKNNKTRYLPRNWYVTDTTELIEDFLRGTQKDKVRKEPEGLKKSSYVPAHVRRIPYGAVMEGLIAEYQGATAAERRETLLEAIRGLRDGTDKLGRRMGKVDMEKIKRLPPAFSKEIAGITDPEGFYLQTRTFVGPYFNPKLNMLGERDLRETYEAVYRTHASALAFLEYALSDMIGLDTPDT